MKLTKIVNIMKFKLNKFYKIKLRKLKFFSNLFVILDNFFFKSYATFLKIITMVKKFINNINNFNIIFLKGLKILKLILFFLLFFILIDYIILLLKELKDDNNVINITDIVTEKIELESEDDSEIVININKKIELESEDDSEIIININKKIELESEDDSEIVINKKIELESEDDSEIVINKKIELESEDDSEIVINTGININSEVFSNFLSQNLRFILHHGGYWISYTYYDKKLENTNDFILINFFSDFGLFKNNYNDLKSILSNTKNLNFNIQDRLSFFCKNNKTVMINVNNNLVSILDKIATKIVDSLINIVYFCNYFFKYKEELELELNLTSKRSVLIENFFILYINFLRTIQFLLIFNKFSVIPLCDPFRQVDLVTIKPVIYQINKIIYILKTNTKFLDELFIFANSQEIFSYIEIKGFLNKLKNNVYLENKDNINIQIEYFLKFLKYKLCFDNACHKEVNITKDDLILILSEWNILVRNLTNIDICFISDELKKLYFLKLWNSSFLLTINLFLSMFKYIPSIANNLLENEIILSQFQSILENILDFSVLLKQQIYFFDFALNKVKFKERTPISFNDGPDWFFLFKYICIYNFDIFNFYLDKSILENDPNFNLDIDKNILKNNSNFEKKKKYLPKLSTVKQYFSLKYSKRGYDNKIQYPPYQDPLEAFLNKINFYMKFEHFKLYRKRRYLTMEDFKLLGYKSYTLLYLIVNMSSQWDKSYKYALDQILEEKERIYKMNPIKGLAGEGLFVEKEKPNDLFVEKEKLNELNLLDWEKYYYKRPSDFVRTSYSNNIYIKDSTISFCDNNNRIVNYFDVKAHETTTSSTSILNRLVINWCIRDLYLDLFRSSNPELISYRVGGKNFLRISLFDIYYNEFNFDDLKMNSFINLSFKSKATLINIYTDINVMKEKIKEGCETVVVKTNENGLTEINKMKQVYLKAIKTENEDLKYKVIKAANTYAINRLCIINSLFTFKSYYDFSFPIISELNIEDKSEDILEDESEDILEDKSEDILEDKSEDILEDKSEDILEDKSEDNSNISLHSNSSEEFLIDKLRNFEIYGSYKRGTSYNYSIYFEKYLKKKYFFNYYNITYLSFIEEELRRPVKIPVKFPVTNPKPLTNPVITPTTNSIPIWSVNPQVKFPVTNPNPVITPTTNSMLILFKNKYNELLNNNNIYLSLRVGFIEREDNQNIGFGLRINLSF